MFSETDLALYRPTEGALGLTARQSHQNDGDSRPDLIPLGGPTRGGDVHRCPIVTSLLTNLSKFRWLEAGTISAYFLGTDGNAEGVIGPQ